ncbi:hypothetical protein D3C81_1183010 [compost metagenome]
MPLRAASTSASTISELAPERYRVWRTASTCGSLAAWRNKSTTGVKDSNGCISRMSCLLITLKMLSAFTRSLGMAGVNGVYCSSGWLSRLVMLNRRVRLTGPLTWYSSLSLRLNCLSR